MFVFLSGVVVFIVEFVELFVCWVVVQGNVMEYCEDFCFFQSGDQFVVIFDIVQFNVEYVCVLFVVGWNCWQFDMFGVCQWQQCIIVVLLQGQVLLVDVFCCFQLCLQIGGLQVGYQIVGVNVLSGIFIYQVVKELVVVGVFFVNNFCVFYQCVIVDQCCFVFIVGGVVFGFMEVEVVDMVDGVQCVFFVGGYYFLCGVFYYKQVVFVGDGYDGVYFVGYVGIMYWDNCLGFIGDGGFDECFVDIYCIVMDINEDDFCFVQYKGVGGGDKGIVGYNYFVVWLDIQQQCGYFQ